jgi:hypothetical protein
MEMAPMTPSHTNQWTLAGDVLENCSCDVVCPGHFTFRNKCTHDYCRAVWAFRIRNGSMDGTDLSDLSAIIVGATPPYMIDGDWKVGLYIEEGASDEQARALESIFTGDAGGPWSILARFVGKRLPTRRVPILFEEGADGRLARVEVPGILEADATPIKGHDKKSVASLVNLYNTLYEPVHIIARGHFHFKDHGMDWKTQERGNHAVLTHFDWSVEAAS